MQAEPLSASDQIKLAAFIVVCVLISGVPPFGGAIPVVIIAYGYIMMRLQSDFDHVSLTVKYAKLYFRLLIVVAVIVFLVVLLLAAIAGTEFYDKYFSSLVYDRFYIDFVGWDVVAIWASVLLVLWGCIGVFQRWYFEPLNCHSDWVAENGAFSKRRRRQSGVGGSKSTVDIIKNESLKQFSVADELSKWAKLRDDGVVSDAEFEQARAKLLKHS